MKELGGIFPSKERRSCFMAYQFRLGLFKEGLYYTTYIPLETFSF